MKQLLVILDGLCEPTSQGTTLETAVTPFLDRLAKKGRVRLLDLQPEAGSPDIPGPVHPSSERGILRLLGFPQNSPIPPRASLLSCLFPSGENAHEAHEEGVAMLLNPARFDRQGGLDDYVGNRESISKLWSFFDSIPPGDCYRDRKSGMRIFPLRDDKRKSILRLLLEIPPDKCPDFSKEGVSPPEKGSRKPDHPFFDWLWKTMAPFSDFSGPLNGWWAWGAGPWQGRTQCVAPGNVMIAGAPIGKAIGAYLGYKTPTVPGATGDVDTNIRSKIEIARSSLLSGDSRVVVHLEGFDLASHRQNRTEKRLFLERFDREVGSLLLEMVEEGLIDALHITSDHRSSPETGDHAPGPVPILSVAKGNAEQMSPGQEGPDPNRTAPVRLTEADAENGHRWSLDHWQQEWTGQ